MKVRILIGAAAIALAWPCGAAAQSVSGLSVKREVVPADVSLDEAAMKAEKREGLRQLIRAAADPATRARLIAQLKALTPEDPVSLAVPAGATASVGDDKTASTGPVFGFQAWRPDDFFAGAFFTFDTAAKLNGDARKAGEFLRNPPALGTSFYASASKMIWALNRDTSVGRFTRAHDDEGQQLAFIGGAVRLGVTNATLEKEEGDKVVAREAFILHVTPSVLLTSRTFREEDNEGEYQFGMELGWTFRWLGGDAAQDKAFLRDPSVLGHDDTRLGGLDGTIFVRLNAFQPFVRITRFSKRDGSHARGLTGAQAFFGVNVLSSFFQTAEKATVR